MLFSARNLQHDVALHLLEQNVSETIPDDTLAQVGLEFELSLEKSITGDVKKIPIRRTKYLSSSGLR